MQTIKYLKNTFSQGGTSYNTVVYYHQIILKGYERAVSNVLYMGSQVVTLCSVTDKSAQFDVFPHHFLNSYIVI